MQTVVATRHSLLESGRLTVRGDHCGQQSYISNCGVVFEESHVQFCGWHMTEQVQQLFTCRQYHQPISIVEQR